MYRLYWSPGGANMAPHAALIQTGAPYELVLVDIDRGQQRSPNYLKLNPHARVPTLAYDGDKIIYESAAICLFLAERHPEARLAPAPGATERGPFLQWMAYLTNTAQEALIQWWHGDLYLMDAPDIANLRARADERLHEIWSFIDRSQAENGPYLCGSTPYVCDIFLAMLARWTRRMAKPASAYPTLGQSLRSIVTAPAYARMLQEEGIDQAI